MVDQPQSTFQDDQDYNIDIPQQFSDFITGSSRQDINTGHKIAIDDIRSQINTDLTNQPSKKVLAALNPNGSNNSGTPNTTTPAQLVQESRCHTFFRIIGFPVVDSSKKLFYNPGLDIIKQGTSRKITDQVKFDIATNPIDGFENLSSARQTYVNNTAKVFANKGSIEASVLALTSGSVGTKGAANLRKFVAPLDKFSNDPFDMTIENQTYSIGAVSLVGNKEVLLNNFQGANASSTNPNYPNTNITNPNLFSSHVHIIMPFIVDPRIDYNVYPMESPNVTGLSKRISVPFAPNNNFRKATANSYAQPPLLEKIIRERFSVVNQNIDSGVATQDLVNYIKDFKAIQDVELVQQIFSSDIYKLSQQSALANYLNQINSMIRALFNALKDIQTAQGIYYWLPSPSLSGPENGSEVQDVIKTNPNLSTDLITQEDLDIIIKNAQTNIANTIASISQSNAISDIGNSFANFFSITLNKDSSSSFGSLSDQSLQGLGNTRNQILAKANAALQIVEMIVGEFSGFGLSDIMAIMGALYIMPQNDLLGFLDDDSFDRMNQFISTSGLTRPDLTQSMTSLTTTVKSLYSIMDDTLQDYLNSNSSHV